MMADSKETYTDQQNEAGTSDTAKPPILPQYSVAQPPLPQGQPQYSHAQSPYPQGQAQYPPTQPQYFHGQPQYGGMQPGPVTTQPMMTSNTTVVIGAPVSQGPREWSDGLCGCFNDCGSCCRGLFCPGLLLMDVSSRMGEGCCFACCCPGAVLGLRIKLRVQENIQGTLWDDYCAVQFCSICVLCQLARELDYVKRR